MEPHSLRSFPMSNILVYKFKGKQKYYLIYPELRVYLNGKYNDISYFSDTRAHYKTYQILLNENPHLYLLAECNPTS